MGFLDENLGGIIGGTAGFFLGGPAGAAAGYNLGSRYDSNAANKRAAEDAQAFSAQQFATRYQTTVKDMEAAGLNPALAYQQGGGAPPTGVSYQSQPGDASSGYSAYQASRVQAAQADLLEAQKGNVEADTAVKRAQPLLIESQIAATGASADQSRASINNLEWQSHQIAANINNIKLDGDRIIELTKQLSAQRDLLIKQGATQEQATAQMKWLAVKTMLEGDLTNLDLAARNKFDNFGAEYKQYAPIVDLLKSIISMKR